MARAAQPDRALLLRAVKWARLPGHGHTIAQACNRFGISATTYRKAARELGAEASLASEEEIVLAGLHPSGPTRVDALVYYFDWVDHRSISRAEVLAILDKLVALGMVRRNGDDFELARAWP
jgi:hypothetical protein